MDGKNHNWLIIQQYLSLSFSYMTFVIKDKIEQGAFNFNNFDSVPYNYIFNKGTSFLDGNMCKKNH